MWYNQINKRFVKMIKFGNREDVVAVDEGNLYLKLVIMMKMQQLLIMQIYNKNDDNYHKKIISKNSLFVYIAKSTIKANRMNFKSISMMKEGFT